MRNLDGVSGVSFLSIVLRRKNWVAADPFWIGGLLSVSGRFSHVSYRHAQGERRPLKIGHTKGAQFRWVGVLSLSRIRLGSICNVGGEFGCGGPLARGRPVGCVGVSESIFDAVLVAAGRLRDNKT
jgi:hypothetical protein